MGFYIYILVTGTAIKFYGVTFFNRFFLWVFLVCLSFGRADIALSNGSFFQTPVDTSYVKTLLEEAQDLTYKGAVEEVFTLIDRAERLSDSLNYEYGKALSQVKLADLYLTTQQIDSAFSVINKAIEDFPESRARVHFYNLLAVAYNYVKEARLSVEAYKKALSFVDSISEDNRDRTRAAILVNMAGAYQNLGDKANTFKNYLEGLRFAEATKDSIFITITLNNLGDTYNSYGEYEKAEYYLSRALEIALAKNYRSDLLRVYSNLGITNTNLEKFEEALQWYEKALELNKEVRPNTPPFQITYNMGRMYARQKNFQKAKEYFERSLEYCKQLNIPQGLYYNYFGLGDLYFNFSATYAALGWYNKALQVAEDLESVPLMQETQQKRYVAFKELEDYENALLAFERFTAISDSLAALESENALSELESKLELDRQTQINMLLEEKTSEQERVLRFRQMLIVGGAIFIIIALLFLYAIIRLARERKKVNSTLNEQKQELEKLNDTKDKLFAIVAHDLRSPLSSLQGILYLISEGDLSLKEIQELSVKLEPTIQKNVDTMNDLLTWAKNQMSGIRIHVEHTPVNPIISEVISKESFQIESKKLKVKNRVPENVTSLVDADLFKIVLRNLLSNSIKFTRSGGEITFDHKDEKLHDIYTVSDTGIGIPEELQPKVFNLISESRKGTKEESGSGFGLSMCKDLVQKMNGEIYLESEVGTGTTLYIKFPKT